ncbi:hypothetical protein B0H17DRAFT_1064515 [Mycena rosella]|uniref:Domain of unknown function at the cortex 1 domain-containing protein n=1 Tax=Mycena rosella TaxID=1033263 RepID=A0AAD7DGA2_MYCRO|nr:hypothetical protein B0H17DRAFT_1064515 [Mycena rosella]
MPKLRVMAGPTPYNLTPITSLVNTNTPHRIVAEDASGWEGDVLVFIKGFNQEDPSLDSTPEAEQYFSKRDGVTWSIQVRGRFLSPRSSDDVLFGNIFERPLKLPWGTGAALKFMKYIDPTLSHDLTCTASQKPWALSPLLATMPYLRHARIPSPDGPCASDTADPLFDPLFPSPTLITEDTSSLHLSAHPVEESRSRTPSSLGSSSSLSSRSSRSSRWSSESKKSKKRKASDDGVPRKMTSQQRRSYFSSEAHRKAVSLGPQDIVTTDFCYGFLEFAPCLRLRLPGGLGFDLARYWDGQPVCFVCCLPGKGFPGHEPESEGSDSSGSDNEEHEDGAGNADDPWGRAFWCVSIEMGSDDDEDQTAAV